MSTMENFPRSPKCEGKLFGHADGGKDRVN